VNLERLADDHAIDDNNGFRTSLASDGEGDEEGDGGRPRD
jgi:hypothetical protein